MSDFARLAEGLIEGTDPVEYAERIGFEPFEWQKIALSPTRKRVALLTARQVGKSTIVSIRALWTALFTPNALVLIVAPSQQQSRELMIKIEDNIAMDGTIDLVSDAAFEKVFTNGSRIVCLPGTERAIRGYSNPHLIIVDEAARVLDEVYKSLRPMMAGGRTTMILLTTPFGQRGFFYRIWMDSQASERWTKIEVPAAHRFIDGQLIIPEPEAEYQARRQRAGVFGFYSPRHTYEFMREELEEMKDAAWFNQEYGVEFIDPEGGAFDMESVLEALVDDEEAIFQVGEVGLAEPLDI